MHFIWLDIIGLVVGHGGIQKQGVVSGTGKSPEEREPFLAAVEGDTYSSFFAENFLEACGVIVRELSQLIERERFLYVLLKPCGCRDVSVSADELVKIPERFVFGQEAAIAQYIIGE